MLDATAATPADVTQAEVTPAEAPAIAPADDPVAFRRALGSFATGVCVVTARDAAGAPIGITANSFASVSLDPPLVLWSPRRASRRFDAFAGAATYAIHVLARDQQPLCDHFVRHAGAFDRLDWSEGPDGVPLLGGALARLVCRREAVLDGGDHAILLGRVLEATRRDGAPLVFHAGRYGGFDPQPGDHPAPEGEP